MQLFTTLLSVLALGFSTTAFPIADAASIKRSEDIVVMAQITEPIHGAVWEVGSKHIVAWNTSTVPPQALSNTASILLGYFDETGLEHVNYGKLHFGSSPHTLLLVMLLFPCSNLTCVDTPLASGFLFKSGHQTVTVPDVTSRRSYFVVCK